jgi:hypothetical protein
MYKVSYVEETGRYPGGIKNEESAPKVGDIVQIGMIKCEVIDVYEILPARNNFEYLQATVKVVEGVKQ